jgi:predicted ATPase
MVLRPQGAVREVVPTIGVIPTLAPVEHREEVLSKNHVRGSIGTRLTSRHFRNLVALAPIIGKRDDPSLVDYILDHTPEITDVKLTRSYEGGDPELDLYMTEAASTTDREVHWIGDGMQIWLQVLLHAWLNVDADVLVLDEPDVYLHPDLQRRLVTLIDSIDSQVILATHAPEMLAESRLGTQRARKLLPGSGADSACRGTASRYDS